MLKFDEKNELNSVNGALAIRLELEKIALKSFGLQWMCRKCRTIDLRPICKKLRVRGHARNTLSPHS